MDDKHVNQLSDNNSDKPIVEQNDEMSERSPEVLSEAVPEVIYEMMSNTI